MNFIQNTKKWFETLQNLEDRLLCPPRKIYSISDNAITKVCSKMNIVQRFFETANDKSPEKIKLTGYVTTPPKPSHNCIIYCHTRNANIEESAFLLHYTLEMQVGVCSFDFRAHGNSEGKYSSLGFWEALDLEAIIEYLVKTTNYKQFVIWGRSMGGVSALNFCSKHYKKTLKHRFKIHLAYQKAAVFVVIDSPFFSMISCAVNLMKALSPGTPELVINGFLMYLDGGIQKKIGVSLEEMNTGLQTYHLKENPYRFIFSLDDELISLSEQNKIFDRVQFWDKKIYKVPGKHNAIRQDAVVLDILNSSKIFLNSLEVERKLKRTQVPSYTSAS